MKIAKLVANSVHPFKAEQTIKGWAGSGFHHRTTEVSVRRVSRDGQEEIQMEISVLEFKGESERLYRHSGALTLTPGQADILVQALQNVKYYRPESTLRSERA